ncbi:hypothetical protein GGR55DRAFT_689712 [Xylaria sp. FL0064]|nr:hypothetical protein GGR55DRAFT_689712 [Xylaria sp. FL0064]
MATDKKILLITGGNTGLGLEAVKALSQSQNAYEIIIGCRTTSKGESAITELKKQFPQTPSTYSTVHIDLESDESLEKAVAEIGSKYGRLDVLINNGGASFDYEMLEGRMSMREGFNATWNVNVTGTHILTTLAIPLLLKSSDPRLIFIASGTATLTETERTDSRNLARINSSPPAGWPKQPIGMVTTAYRSSKTGLNMLMREGVSPGFLATGLGGMGSDKLKEMGALDPAIGGHFLKDVVEGKRDHDQGKVIRKDMIQPW